MNWRNGQAGVVSTKIEALPSSILTLRIMFSSQLCGVLGLTGRKTSNTELELSMSDMAFFTTLGGATDAIKLPSKSS